MSNSYKKSAKAVISGILVTLYLDRVFWLALFVLDSLSTVTQRIISDYFPFVHAMFFADDYDHRIVFTAIISMICIAGLACLFKKKSIAVAGVKIVAILISAIVYHSVQGNHDAHLKYEKLMVVFSFLFIASMIFMIYSAVKYIKSSKEITAEKHNLKQVF